MEVLAKAVLWIDSCRINSMKTVFTQSALSFLTRTSKLMEINTHYSKCIFAAGVWLAVFEDLNIKFAFWTWICECFLWQGLKISLNDDDDHQLEKSKRFQFGFILDAGTLQVRNVSKHSVHHSIVAPIFVY